MPCVGMHGNKIRWWFPRRVTLALLRIRPFIDDSLCCLYKSVAARSSGDPSSAISQKKIIFSHYYAVAGVYNHQSSIMEFCFIDSKFWISVSSLTKEGCFCIAEEDDVEVGKTVECRLRGRRN